jgi:hypothetical protein
MSPFFKKRKHNVKPRQLRNFFLHHLTNAIEEETREKCDSEFKLKSPISSGDEFMEESGFMGDDEEDVSSDDSNNEVEFFPVHQPGERAEGRRGRCVLRCFTIAHVK